MFWSENGFLFGLEMNRTVQVNVRCAKGESRGSVWKTKTPLYYKNPSERQSSESWLQVLQSVMEVSATFLLSVLILALLWFFSGKNTQKYRLPPGPSPLPLIGNLLQMKKTAPFKSFLEVSLWLKIFCTVRTGLVKAFGFFPQLQHKNVHVFCWEFN